MNKTFDVANVEAIFSKGKYTYERVIDDFLKTKFIGILTYNISPNPESKLLASLKRACCNGADAVIVTHIPKRFPSYYGVKYAVAAKDMIDLYIQQLNPQKFGMRLSPYFTFCNHAKVVLTDNIIYWGSSNFSDESCDNFECGTISTDKELIEYVKDMLFSEIKKEEYVPYYKYNFAVAIANIESLIPVCQRAKDDLFDAAFEPWADYETNFEERWIYRTTDSGITVEFLHKFIEFFAGFDDALGVINSIIDEYWELDELPEEVQQLLVLFENYNQSFAMFYDSISTLFEELEGIANYDVSEEANRKIVEDYSMEAYDENLEHYAEKAMQEASDEYSELIENSEATVRDSLEKLDEMLDYFQKLNSNLHKLLKINARIDNTGIL